MTENRELMKMAQNSLKNKWGVAIGTFLVMTLINLGIQKIPHIGFLLTLLYSGPMTLGFAIFSLSISRDQEARFEQVFKGFSDYKRAISTYLLMVLMIILWTLLLIVPGIIACFSYSMTFFLLADDGSLKPMEALELSKKMMDGYKMKLFRLYLRFLGLALLCILTLGIGFIWLIPFVQICLAKFYTELVAKKISTSSI